MNRRQFLGAASMLAFKSAHAQVQPDRAVNRVLVMFKCHLDVGFIDTQANIIQRYFKTFYPAAIEIAGKMRDAGSDHYTWTTGSWMLYEYLEQATAAERKRMEAAIARNDIAWHALPFTWQTELLEPATIAGGVSFSKSLDGRFGRTTTGAKMTDVPGHTRGLIAPLADSGVRFLDIGVNAASTPPDVPELFVWKDARGKELVMMYHRLAYGGVVRVPGTDLAVAVEMADDNYGPHKPEEIRKIYQDLRAQFPNAKIHAANLTEIAEAVVPHKAAFPVLTQEIGDTWIYGVASDPIKLARFRELQRLRTEWIAQGKLHAGDAPDRAFLSKFLLGAEHTWGTDTKTWLDFDHYTPDALASMLQTPKYKVVTNSWIEKRADLDAAANSLPASLRSEATRRLAGLKAQRPNVTGLTNRDPAQAFETRHFTIRLDPASGGIIEFRENTTGRAWASPEHALALVQYQTLSKADYDRFLAQYITVQTDWAPKDFGKPKIDQFGAKSAVTAARLVKCLANEERLLMQLSFDAEGAPREVFVDLSFPREERRMDIRVSWFGKRANRMPEAIWFTMNPNGVRNEGWVFSKAGSEVSPFDVVSGGNRHMHALSSSASANSLAYKDDRGAMSIDSTDAALAVLGELSPIYFSNDQPDITKGIHFSLFNNGWGTNYVQWFGEDASFRFSLEV